MILLDFKIKLKYFCSLIHCESGEIGRRARLKIWCTYVRVGSSPTSGTTISLKMSLKGAV